ncbi:hypothetical protein F5051DRAFT_431570 [Lentinula edodes]|nr:hypothetical protein F5051DRAFT_431570 [Lentinula edodes]
MRDPAHLLSTHDKRLDFAPFCSGSRSRSTYWWMEGRRKSFNKGNKSDKVGYYTFPALPMSFEDSLACLGPVSITPNEIWYHIGGFADHQSVVALAACNRRLSGILHPMIWKTLRIHQPAKLIEYAPVWKKRARQIFPLVKKVILGNVQSFDVIVEHSVARYRYGNDWRKHTAILRLFTSLRSITFIGMFFPRRFALVLDSLTTVEELSLVRCCFHPLVDFTGVNRNIRRLMAEIMCWHGVSQSLSLIRCLDPEYVVVVWRSSFVGKNFITELPKSVRTLTVKSTMWTWPTDESCCVRERSRFVQFMEAFPQLKELRIEGRVPNRQGDATFLTHLPSLESYSGPMHLFTSGGIDAKLLKFVNFTDDRVASMAVYNHLPDMRDVTGFTMRGSVTDDEVYAQIMERCPNLDTLRVLAPASAGNWLRISKIRSLEQSTSLRHITLGGRSWRRVGNKGVGNDWEVWKVTQYDSRLVSDVVVPGEFLGGGVVRGVFHTRL